MDAVPEWAALQRAVTPEPLFGWQAAHRLADGTRVDEFVHRTSTLLLLISDDGRVWSSCGMAPGGAAGFVLLEAVGAREAVADVLTASHCDRWLHEAAQARDGRQTWDDVAARPCDPQRLGHPRPGDGGR